MPDFAYFIVFLLQIVLFVLQIAMFLRAVLSWFPGTDESAIYNFVVMITEPFIVPVRALFDRFGWFADMPLDIPFFVTYILLSLFGVIVEMAL